MERIPKGIYTQEFREQAIRLVEVDGLPIMEAARRLSLPVGSLKNWLYAARKGKLREIGKGQKPLTDMEMEFLLGPFFDLDKVVGTRQYRTNGHDQ